MTYASLKLKFHLGGKKTGFKLHIMIHFILLIIIFCSCGAQKSITMAHVERIEERVMPIPVGADTIEIELCRDTRLECLNEQSESQCRDTRLECPMTRKGQNPTNTANPTFDPRPSTIDTQNIKTCLLGRDFAQQKQDHYVKEKSSYVFLSKNTTSTASPQSVHSVQSVGDNHSEGVKSVSSVERLLAQQESESRKEKKDKKISEKSVQSVGDNHSEGVNSVRISSTRGINISRHETDTSTRIRLTLRPDTVFVPYTNHIRSDTIVVPDPTTQAKLTTARWQIAMLLLIIIVATIIFILKDKKT